MAVTLPNGSTIAIGSAVGSAQATTILTNANPCVATVSAHGYSDGDYVIVVSGWSRINGKVFRVNVLTSSTFQLEGLNTSSTTIYPAGSGLGTVQEVTTFTQITQVLSTSSTGGEQRYLTYQFLEADAEVDIPTVKSGGGFNFEIGDDPDLAGFDALVAANDDRVARAFKVTLANSAILMYLGYVSINKTPTLEVNTLMRLAGSVRFLNEPVRYADGTVVSV
jgi:hypothetical protein